MECIIYRWLPSPPSPQNKRWKCRRRRRGTGGGSRAIRKDLRDALKRKSPPCSSFLRHAIEAQTCTGKHEYARTYLGGSGGSGGGGGGKAPLGRSVEVSRWSGVYPSRD